jgi:hypothetical protein
MDSSDQDECNFAFVDSTMAVSLLQTRLSVESQPIYAQKYNLTGSANSANGSALAPMPTEGVLTNVTSKHRSPRKIRSLIGVSSLTTGDPDYDPKHPMYKIAPPSTPEGDFHGGLRYFKASRETGFWLAWILGAVAYQVMLWRQVDRSSTQAKPRDGRWDMVKFWCIVFVLWSHFMGFYRDKSFQGFPQEFISRIHMPAFSFVSGLMQAGYATTGNGQVVSDCAKPQNAVRDLLLSQLTVILLARLTDFICYVQLSLKDFALFFEWVVPTSPLCNLGIWYLTSLFVWQLATPVLCTLQFPVLFAMMISVWFGGRESEFAGLFFYYVFFVIGYVLGGGGKAGDERAAARSRLERSLSDTKTRIAAFVFLIILASTTYMIATSTTTLSVGDRVFAYKEARILSTTVPKFSLGTLTAVSPNLAVTWDIDPSLKTWVLHHNEQGVEAGDVQDEPGTIEIKKAAYYPYRLIFDMNTDFMRKLTPWHMGGWFTDAARICFAFTVMMSFLVLIFMLPNSEFLSSAGSKTLYTYVLQAQFVMGQPCWGVVLGCVPFQWQVTLAFFISFAMALVLGSEFTVLCTRVFVQPQWLLDIIKLPAKVQQSQVGGAGKFETSAGEDARAGKA